MDYFASLPPEVTQGIFDELDLSDKGLRSPLSKRLLPVQRRRLFRSVQLDAYEELSLACEIARRQHSPFAYTDYQKIDDSFAPTDEQIWTFFRSLVHVETLSVTSPRLSSLILAPEVSQSIFPNLTNLSLSSSFSDFDDPFDPSHYTSLSQYPNLKILTLDVERNSSSIKPLSQPRSLPSTSCKLTDITLEGPLSTCQASVTSLINSYAFLEAIYLVDKSDSSRLYDVVSGFGVHPQLVALGLERSKGNLLPPQGNITDAVLEFPRQFPDLGYLRLGGSCDLSSSSFYDALRTLSLDEIFFDLGTHPSLKELTKLISSGKMNQKFETITFDNVEGERGTLIEGTYDDDELDKLEDPPGWVLPKWTEDFHEMALTKFIKVAEREGIEVVGSAIEASDIEVEYAQECEKLGLLHYRREVISSW